MSIFKQNVYIAHGVSMPNTKSTKVKAKVLTKLSAGQTLTMYSNLAIASILLTSAENSFRYFKKVADFDPDCEEVVKMYESFMMNVGEAGLAMENALKNDTTSAKVFNTMERPLKAYIKKGLNISNFTNHDHLNACIITKEGHYRAESNDRTATGDPQTILDLVVIKQGNGFRCINTDGSFKSYSYSDIKNEFQFFKTKLVMLSETVDKAIDVFGMLQAPVTISYQTFLKRIKLTYPVDKQAYLCPKTGATKYTYTIQKHCIKQILNNPYFNHALRKNYKTSPKAQTTTTRVGP